jgi:hypothetical protein
MEMGSLDGKVISLFFINALLAHGQASEQEIKSLLSLPQLLLTTGR